MQTLINFIRQLHQTIQSTIGYPALLVLIVIVVLIIYLLWYTHVRQQYSDEGWKIRKKNGRKAIFWYDEYGNKVYKRPEKSNPPPHSKRFQ